MDAQELSNYLSQAHAAFNNAWERDLLRSLSVLQTPQNVLGSQAWLLEADVRVTWTQWFIDSLVSRSRYIEDLNLRYSHLYFDVHRQLQIKYPHVPADELREAARVVSELAWEDINRRREIRRRSIPRQVREDLWLAAEPSPRCYLCGYLFTSQARDRLLRRTAGRNVAYELPLLVDFARPRGLRERDLGIEVDHVSPVSMGGLTSLENLRLACGWCNRVKSDRRSLYEAPAGMVRRVSIRGLGTVAVPQPLWVLRMVAIRGRCEHSSGCTAKLDTHELFIAPGNLAGTLNPVNTLIVCSDHDPWASSRYVGRRSLLGS